MKIRMKVDLSGTRNGQPWPARGEVADVPDAEGAALCSAGMAEPVAEPPAEKVETATPPADDVEKREAEPKPAAKPNPKPAARSPRGRK